MVIPWHTAYHGIMLCTYLLTMFRETLDFLMGQCISMLVDKLWLWKGAHPRMIIALQAVLLTLLLYLQFDVCGT